MWIQCSLMLADKKFYNIFQWKPYDATTMTVKAIIKKIKNMIPTMR